MNPVIFYLITAPFGVIASAVLMVNYIRKHSTVPALCAAFILMGNLVLLMALAQRLLVTK